MEATDLRIGNLIEHDGEFYEIDSISKVFPTLNTIKFGIGVIDWNNIKPIPLTEEWLLKFGFENDGEGYKQYWHINDFEIEQHGDKFPIRIWGGESAPHLTQYIGHRTKYVHQLQNLYYALTGEELTTKNQ